MIGAMNPGSLAGSPGLFRHRNPNQKPNQSGLSQNIHRWPLYVEGNAVQTGSAFRADQRNHCGSRHGTAVFTCALFQQCLSVVTPLVSASSPAHLPSIHHQGEPDDEWIFLSRSWHRGVWRGRGRGLLQILLTSSLTFSFCPPSSLLLSFSPLHAMLLWTRGSISNDVFLLNPLLSSPLLLRGGKGD